MCWRCSPTNVIGSNPVREVSPIRSKGGAKDARALTADELVELLAKQLRAWGVLPRARPGRPDHALHCHGGRRSESLGFRWVDYEDKAGTLSVTGKVIQAAGKTATSRRTLPLPSFAVITLTERRQKPFLGQQEMIFPSMNGMLRDPDNFGARWRKVRDDLGVGNVTSHSFRKTLATLIDDEGLSARIGAEHLGHSASPKHKTPKWPVGGYIPKLRTC